MTRKPKILVVGSLVMDLIVSTPQFPQSGETVLGSNYHTAPGGKGANQAVQAARLGAEVTLVGKVGNDSFGEALIKSAMAAGVNTTHVFHTPSAHTAVGNVQLEIADGRSANRIIVVPGANMMLSKDDVAFLEGDIGTYDMVLLQLEIPMEINQLVAAFAREADVPVMLNCAPIAPLPLDLLKNVTYLSPNEHEARVLTDIEVHDDHSIQAAFHAIHSLGVKNALITLGARGVAYDKGDGQYLISPALDGLNVVDTTAAGDSFIGAFCTAVSLQVPIEQALCFANHTAALTVCRMGAQPSLPFIDEVLLLMQQRGTDCNLFQMLAK